MDDKILFLYAQGMTTREIVATFKEMYGADVSASLISKVTDAVIDEVLEWQSRPLNAVYPIIVSAQQTTPYTRDMIQDSSACNFSSSDILGSFVNTSRKYA
jgi:hypothetical protein